MLAAGAMTEADLAMLQQQVCMGHARRPWAVVCGPQVVVCVSGFVPHQ